MFDNHLTRGEDLLPLDHTIFSRHEIGGRSVYKGQVAGQALQVGAAIEHTGSNLGKYTKEKARRRSGCSRTFTRKWPGNYQKYCTKKLLPPSLPSGHNLDRSTRRIDVQR